VTTAETQIRTDFIAGSRERADHFAVLLHLSSTGPADWRCKIGDIQNINLVTDDNNFGSRTYN